MSLKNRIRRIEDKLGAAVKPNGEPLPVPDLITQYFKPLLNVEGKNVQGGQPSDFNRASVSCHENETRFYDRKAGESLEEFQDRALASTPRGKFPRVFTPMLVTHEDE